MSSTPIALRWSLCTVLAAALAAAAGAFAPSSAPSSDPQVIELTGVIRDFREKNAAGGHPDFEQKPSLDFALYNKNIANTLGDDGKPVFIGGGKKVDKQWKDSAGRPIFHKLYNPALGDKPGSFGGNSTGGIKNAASFNQWFRDVPGVNVSMPLTLKLVRQADGSYVFDDKLDPIYDNLGGFFPIDSQLLGNSGGSPHHNFHFTYELHTEFTYDADASQVFKFIGDDDVWVFIDGKMVIDIGGVHGAVEQYVALNRLGLEDGKTYALDFFFAERHRTQSNFRISTNLKLQNLMPPTISASFD